MQKGQSVLVTGGAGYIGSWVVRRLLSAGYRVTIYDCLKFGGASLLGIIGHPALKFIKGDIRDVSRLRDALKGIDYVAHLAALVGEAACDLDPEETLAINFAGTKIVSESAIEAGVKRFIFFSTCSSYGVKDTTQLANENTTLKPVSLYAKTKIDSENFLLENVNRNLVLTVFRLATIHGPSARMRFDLIVNHFVRDAYLNGELDIFGPEMWRPLMWVGDAAQGVQLALEADEAKVGGEVFNLGATEANYQKKRIGEIIRDHFIPELKLKFSGSDKDLRSYRVDFSKIENKLGFKQTHDLESAIGHLLELLKTGIITDPNNSIYSNG